jgi:Dynamin family
MDNGKRSVSASGVVPHRTVADGGVPAGVTQALGGPSSADGDPLSEYRRRKLELAEFIRAAMSISGERHDEERQAEARELLASLADDCFQLAVVGQFSRGKSTLMNAMLGHPYLPTGALPMTSVVTTVRFGSRPSAFVRRASSTVPIETSLDDLVRFVAQSSHEREELQVVAADIEVPAEILRLGFWFVDTPGIGSAITANTATTERFLPHADAVIFVTSFDAPLSDAELEFLAKVRRHVEKLFVVVNKLDLVSPRESQAIVAYVRERLGEPGGDAELRLFATSARRALEAKLRRDRVAFAESGLPALEQTLVHFLTAEKSRVFLRRVSGRAVQLLARQRLDLELGRAAQAQHGPGAGDPGERVRDRLAQLDGEARALTEALLGHVREELPAQLLEHSRAWPGELRDLLVRELGRRLPADGAHVGRGELERALRATEEAARALFAEWLEQRASDVRALVLRIAGGAVERLLALERSVQSRAAETVGLSLDALGPAPTGWSPSELEPLKAPTVAFAMRLDVPRWSVLAATARLSGNARSRVIDSAERSANSFCGEARDGFLDAAYAWVKRLGARAEVDTRRAADRVLERVRSPGSDGHIARLEQTRRLLEEFRSELLGWRPAAADVGLAELRSPRPAAPPANLLGPCVICARVGGVPFDYLAHAQYRLASREESRSEHAESGGFCQLHTWLYAQVAEPVGIALSYARLAESATQLLRAAASGETELEDAVSHFLPDRDRCPVCLALATVEREAVERVLEDVSDAAGDAAVPPVCMPHLAVVLTAARDNERSGRLAGRLADGLERASEDMRTFALKRQSLRRGLLSDEERAAYLYVIERIAGTRALARPWRTDEDDRLP